MTQIVASSVGGNHARLWVEQMANFVEVRNEDGGVQQLTADGARELARQLVEAASRLERPTRPTGRVTNVHLSPERLDAMLSEGMRDVRRGDATYPYRRRW